jgi:hypothetical protein
MTPGSYARMLAFVEAMELRLARLDADLERRRALREARLRSCGARCRSKGGAPCSAPVVVRTLAVEGVVRLRISNRCRMHGGLSTGARTAAGRARLREAGRRGAIERWRRACARKA